MVNLWLAKMNDWDEQQVETWDRLHDQVDALLERYGTEDSSGHADYWINHDNYGWKRLTFGANNLKMLAPDIIGELRTFLTELPDWEIVAVANVVEKEEQWPLMGLTIRRHEIVDGLQRHLFDEPYRSYRYPDSRVGTGFD